MRKARQLFATVVVVFAFVVGCSVGQHMPTTQPEGVPAVQTDGGR